MIPAEKAGLAQLHRILVVEDEVLVLVDTADYLRGRGFDVVEATNADDALKVLAAGIPISLVFTDVNMPGSLDGLALAQYIRMNHPTIHVVVTSGHVKAGDVPQDIAPPIGKPYALHDIGTLFETLLASNASQGT